MVGVAVELSLGNLDVLFRNDLVEGEGSSAENLAGVAVARNVSVKQFDVVSAG